MTTEPADETYSVHGSSCISEIGYREGDVITVTFHRGGSLTSDFDGDHKTYLEFRNANSKGQFFNQHWGSK